MREVQTSLIVCNSSIFQQKKSDGFCHQNEKEKRNHKSPIEWHSNYFMCSDLTLRFVCVETHARQFELLIPFIHIISPSLTLYFLYLCLNRLFAFTHRNKNEKKSKAKDYSRRADKAIHAKSTFIMCPHSNCFPMYRESRAVSFTER